MVSLNKGVSDQPPTVLDFSENKFEFKSIAKLKDKSLCSYVVGFRDDDECYDKTLVICSIVSIIPVIGGFSCLCSGAVWNTWEFLTSKHVSCIKKLGCGFLFSVRTLLSCFGLGLVFFLLDLLYTLGCYLLKHN